MQDFNPANSDNAAKTTPLSKQEQQSARWAKVRSRGKWRFVLLHGIVFFGLFTGILYVIVLAVFRNLQNDLALFDGQGFGSFGEAVLMVVFFALFAGTIYGYLLWRMNDWMYRSHMSKNESKTSD